MTVIIPAYKPDEKLIQLLRDLKSQCDARLLVVNDGSGEAYDPVFRRVEELGATLLVHPVNKGKGAALKTALQSLLEEGKKEFVCTADADGQHLPKDILRCMEEAKSHPDSLVLGSRSFRGDNVPSRSRWGNAISRHTFYCLMGKKVYDTQTGLRAFSSDLIPEMLAVEGDRYEYEMQVLCNAAKRKIPIREVEIETVYLEENRSSHFNPLKDALRVYGILLRAAFGRAFEFLSFLFSSVAAFLVDVVLYMVLLRLIFGGALASLLPEGLQLFFSLLLSRTISSWCNYLINRGVVFCQLQKKGKTFILYLFLVVAVFFGNHFLNSYFHLTLEIPELWSLILAQCLCFPISFLVQKFFIFKK